MKTTATLKRILPGSLACLFAACGAAQEVAPGPRSPNPNGCYALIYEGPRFTGAGEVVNGPVRWPLLAGLRETQQETWENRVRSVRMGPNATLTVYTDRDFKGDPLTFSAGIDAAELAPPFVARIKSLTLTCS